MAEEKAHTHTYSFTWRKSRFGWLERKKNGEGNWSNGAQGGGGQFPLGHRCQMNDILKFSWDNRG